MIEYYKGNKDKALYSEALYYGGRVYSDLGDYPTALNYFHQALDKLPESSKGTDLEANIVSQTGRLLQTLRLYDEAIPYVERSIEIDSLTNDTINWVYDLQLLGGIYMRKGNLNNAQSFFKETLKFKEFIDPQDYFKSVMYLAETKRKLGELDSAQILIRNLIDKIKPTVRNEGLIYSALIFRDAGDLDSSYLMLKQLLDSPLPNQKNISYDMLISPDFKLYSSQDTLTYYLLQYRKFLEKSLNSNMSELVINRQNQYNYQLHDRERKKTEIINRKLSNIIVSIVLVVLVLIIIVLYICNRNIKNKIRIHEYAEKIRILKLRQQQIESDLNDEKNKNIERQNTLASSFVLIPKSDGNDIRKRLREELRFLHDSEEAISMPAGLINSKVKKKLDELINLNEPIKDASGLWKDIEETILNISPDFKENITLLTVGKISTVEFQTAMLIKLGFSPTEMSKLTGRSKGTIVSRRESLCLKIFGEKYGTKFIDSIIRLL